MHCSGGSKQSDYFYCYEIPRKRSTETGRDKRTDRQGNRD